MLKPHTQIDKCGASVAAEIYGTNGPITEHQMYGAPTRQKSDNSNLGYSNHIFNTFHTYWIITVVMKAIKE
jgi:hypothetical protein